ncbi:MAG: DUF4199 family protein [Crocinitomicaceae bacterium]|nr:DUF4199 family protein [Crocinitomicaceae bacterium]
MKTTVKYGLIFGLSWIIITMILFYADFSREAFLPLIMVNLFLLLMAIAGGLYMTKKEKNFEPGIFADDFKTAMQGGIIYAILISGFVYLYHWKIDTSIRDAIIQERITALHNAVPDSDTYEELQEDDPTWQDKSYDDYIENQEDQIKGVVSPVSIFIMHLAGLCMLTFFYAFGATFIIRKVVLKGIQ